MVAIWLQHFEFSLPVFKGERVGMEHRMQYLSLLVRKEKVLTQILPSECCVLKKNLKKSLRIATHKKVHNMDVQLMIRKNEHLNQEIEYCQHSRTLHLAFSLITTISLPQKGPPS